MPRIQLVITMDESGRVDVTGPIDQKLLCYGLLAVAHEVVHDHCAAAQQRLVQPATAVPLSLIKGS